MILATYLHQSSSEYQAGLTVFPCASASLRPLRLSIYFYTAVPLTLWSRYQCDDMGSVSWIKTVCRTDAAAEPSWMACFTCL